MTDVFVLACFLALCASTTLQIVRTNFYALNFPDGLLFGAAYYLVVPLIVSFGTGELNSAFFHTGAYRPFEDLETTFNLFLGWGLVLVVHVIGRRGNQRRSRGPAVHSSRGVGLSSGKVRLFLLTVVLVAFDLIVLIASQKLEGSHWQEAMQAAYQRNSSIIVFANFANIYRTTVFGCILYLYASGDLGRITCGVLAFALAVGDIVVTFNRITALYFMVVLLIAYRHRFFTTIALIGIAAPVVSYLSNVWTVFRGIVLHGALSLDNILAAFALASQSNQSTQADLTNKLDSIFESSNIAVFNYLIKNTPNYFEPLWGWTFFLRPLTIFVPSTMWGGKPPVFGSLLGFNVEKVTGLSINSTLFGEAYGNFYYLWPIPLLFMLAFLSVVFRYMTRSNPVWGFYGCFLGLALWRFDMAFAFIGIFAIVMFESAFRILIVISESLPSTRVRNVQIRNQSSGRPPR